MEFGWKRIWKLYGLKELFSIRNRLFYFSVLVVFLFIFLIAATKNDGSLVYFLLQKTLEVGLSILPTLLGFNLGAYALIIGFLTNEKLKLAITAQDNDLSSGLEKISSVFAINIIIQALTLMLAFVIKQASIIFENITIKDCLRNIFYEEKYVNAVNYVTLTIMLFMTLYSVVLVIQNAINIFDFSQLFTYFSKKDGDIK